MIKKPLIVFGAGGLGREVKTIVDVLPDWYVEGFYDDVSPVDTIVNGVKVLGDSDFLLKQPEVFVVVAIGDPHMKQRVVNKLSLAKGIHFVTVIHPRAILGDLTSVDIGDGSIITAGCILTTSITIGKHVLINLNTTVGHDVTIGDCSSIMPGVNLAGEVEIGSGVLVGSGANVLNKISVGSNAIVGSGAVVTKNVSEGVTVVGVPAREIRH
jgi:sugar O-acyltransferase (sialic acid O-acetyltransferase NeuD family)